MKTRNVSLIGNISVALSLLFVYGSAQGMLEEFKQKTLKFLLENKESMISGGGGFGAGFMLGWGSKSLLGRPNESEDSAVPKAPSFNPSFKFLEERPKVNEKQETKGKVYVSEAQIMGLLGVKEVPINWLALLCKKHFNEGRKASVQSELCALQKGAKQYQTILAQFLGEEIQSTVDLKAKLKKKVQKEVKEKEKRLEIMISDAFGTQLGTQQRQKNENIGDYLTRLIDQLGLKKK